MLLKWSLYIFKYITSGLPFIKAFLPRLINNLYVFIFIEIININVSVKTCLKIGDRKNGYLSVTEVNFVIILLNAYITFSPLVPQ